MLTCLLGLAVLLGIPSPALAFTVDLPTTFHADPNHEKITQEALADFQVKVGDETFKFTQKAIEQIVNANKHIDDPPNQFESKMHFDDEDFSGGSQRVMRRKERVITKVTGSDPQGTSARNDLGTTLHTVQDFYAHSNWVELGHSGSDINTKLGREELPKATNKATCSKDPGTLDGAGLTELTSGYFILSDGLACGVPQGKCRHGFIPCPDGLNKDDKSRRGFDSARTLAVNATKDFLEQIFGDPRLERNVEAIKLLMRIRN